MVPELGHSRVGTPGSPGIIGHEPFVTGSSFPLGNDGILNCRVAGEGGLDLAQLHTEPADFDLVIAAAQEFDVAIGQVTSQVTAPIKASVRAGPERMRDKPLCRQLRGAAIAPRDAASAHINLPARPRGHRLPQVIQDEHLQIRQRRPPNEASSVLHVRGQDHPRGHMDRRFGDAVTC